MSTRNKTGGGRGTNQYQIKGRAKEKQAKPKTATSLVQAKPERRSLEGLPNGGLGVRSPKERLEDIRDLCLEQGKDLREVLRSAWGKAHPREPLPVEWELASSMGQVWVPDERTLYQVEHRLLYGEWPRFNWVDGEVLRSSGYIWEIYLDPSGTRWYYCDRQLHREDGPAVVWNDGSVQYHVESKLHRLDGPAVVKADGTVSYWVNGKLHRLDGPAVVKADGTVSYWVNDKRHRIDGPAVVKADGTVEYYVGGKQLTEAEFLACYSQGQAN